MLWVEIKAWKQDSAEVEELVDNINLLAEIQSNVHVILMKLILTFASSRSEREDLKSYDNFISTFLPLNITSYSFR